MAAPTPPELELWRGRGLQTPTGPMDRDFGKFHEPPRQACGAPEHFKQPSSCLHCPHVEPPKTPKCSELAPSKLRHNLATGSTKLSETGISNYPMNLRSVRRNARSA